jgi:glutamate carboxypeptidase
MTDTVLSLLTQALPGMIADLETLVCCESPTEDLAANERCADLVAGVGVELLGAHPERLERDGRPILRWR